MNEYDAYLEMKRKRRVMKKLSEDKIAKRNFRIAAIGIWSALAIVVIVFVSHM